jgi:Uma2 family endonuclease
LLLSCDPDDRADYFSQTPSLIIEVLSESTERIDRREKMLAYQTLSSLQEYVLVAQDDRQVEIYRRRNEWKPEIINDGLFHLDCLDVNISIDDVYEDVTV